MKLKAGKFKLNRGESGCNKNYTPFTAKTLVGVMTELSRRSIGYNSSVTRTKCGYIIDIKNGIVSFKKIP